VEVQVESNVIMMSWTICYRIYMIWKETAMNCKMQRKKSPLGNHLATINCIF